ncbi:MAG: T9SS type A sorting domain-containing protein, partial [Bacteroidia bacterium]|nr:T9SS type A sorting domain-containing protein [Bacteroidia bacterium]
FEDSQIELGHDGHLYLATSNRLAVIKSPNTPSTSNWVNSYIALPNPYSSTPIGYECYGSPSTLCGALNPLYILPDQIDGENYFVSASIISYTAGTFPYTATTQTWTPTNNPFGGTSTNPVGTATNPILVLDKIVIPPGYNITIQGMTFKFKARTIDYSTGSAVISWGARVLVQNVMSTTGPQSGARLTLTSLGTTPSVFTSDDVCSNGMWEGVEVWGNHTLVQGVFSGLTAGKQGWFRMFNSSEISNAYIGALAGKKYYDATVTYVYNTPSFGGGIIQASSNSQFLNNSFGAYFMPYNIGNNLSYFTTVKFTTNQPFVSADNALPVNQVYMNDVKGIYFRTCTFFNDLSTSGYLQTFLGLTQVNMGIKAIHSQFYCIPNIVGSTNGCSFEGLKYGVYATFTSNAKTLTVDYGKFINNYRGAYLSAATLTPTVVRSSFHVMNYSHSVLNNRAYGLYLNACNEYKIEENYFTTYTGATTANNYGIIVNNSGPYPNVIKRNTFDKVYAGIQTQNQNCWLNPAPTVFNPVNDFGLQNRCNTFTSIKEMDMGITSGCVDFHQGTNGNPAGNNFSHSGNTAYNDYFTYAPSVNNQGRIGYWYDASPARTPLQYTPNPEITIANTIIDDPANHCKTSFSSFHLTLLIEDLKNKINDYQTKITDLKLRLDEGANGSLINAINSTMSAGNLKNLLMSKSPYLSDEILIAYFTKNGLPNGHLKEVAIVNSPLTADVKAILTTVSLPPGIRNQINAAQTTNQSKRQKTIDLVKYYQFEISILKNDMVRNYVNDSTVEIKIDTIISRVKEFEDIDVVSTVKTKEMLADLYIEKQDYVNAEDMIVAIEAEPNKQNLAKLKRVHKNLKQSNQTVYDLPSNLAERQKVEDVATDNNLQGYEAAINILQDVFNQSYEEPIEELVPALHRYIPMEENSSIIANEPTVVCFPNPANQSISFLYSLQDETDVASINIYNALGQIVKTITINNTDVRYDVNIIDLPNGLYFYTLIVNSTTIANDKFVKSN